MLMEISQTLLHRDMPSVCSVGRRYRLENSISVPFLTCVLLVRRVPSVAMFCSEGMLPG